VAGCGCGCCRSYSASAPCSFVPFDLPTVANHDFGAFLAAEDRRGLLHGNWGLYVLVLVMMTFNTVLGEELLFRGLLLAPDAGQLRPGRLGGQRFLMGAYHLHQPWSIPTSIVAGLLMAYPRSAGGAPGWASSSTRHPERRLGRGHPGLGARVAGSTDRESDAHLISP